MSTDHEVRVIHFYGAKGGVGTTTAAVLAGLELHRQGETVRLMEPSGDLGDLRAVLGFVGDVDRLVLGKGEPTVTIIDNGTTPPSEPQGRVFLVTRPCYLALRRAVAHITRPDGIILFKERGRSLDSRDVEEVIGRPVVVEIEITESLARIIDAGLLDSHPRRIPPVVLPL